MTIRGEEVVVERDGEQPVRFSLKRAPELLGKLSSFGALPSGDRTLLDRHFAPASRATMCDRAWC